MSKKIMVLTMMLLLVLQVSSSVKFENDVINYEEFSNISYLGNINLIGTLNNDNTYSKANTKIDIITINYNMQEEEEKNNYINNRESLEILFESLITRVSLQNYHLDFYILESITKLELKYLNDSSLLGNTEIYYHTENIEDNKIEYIKANNDPEYEIDPGGTAKPKSKIAILEAYGYPDMSHQKFSGLDYESLTDYPLLDKYHATKVLEVFVTENSNFDEYKLFIEPIFGVTDLFNKIDKMVTNKVNIISMSFSQSGNTEYDILALFIDYIAVQHNILFVTGTNNITSDYPDPTIPSPGTSSNILTIGRIDKNFKYNYNSGYEVGVRGLNFKPNLVDFDHTIDNSQHGSSMSVPRVSAKAAKLIYKYPGLKYNIGALLSVIHTSSSRNSIHNHLNQINARGFDKTVGAGYFLDTIADSVMATNNYFSINVKSNTDIFPGSILLLDKMIFANNQRVIISATLPTKISNSPNYHIGNHRENVTLKVYLNNDLVFEFIGKNTIYFDSGSKYNGNVRFELIHNGFSGATPSNLGLSFRTVT